MRQSRGALQRPVAELESQYQNALAQNGTFNPTEQDHTTRSPQRVPPTLQHVPVHEDPQRYYNVDNTSFAPSASEIFIFGEAFSPHSPLEAGRALSNSQTFLVLGFFLKSQTTTAWRPSRACRCRSNRPFRRSSLFRTGSGPASTAG